MSPSIIKIFAAKNMLCASVGTKGVTQDKFAVEEAMSWALWQIESTTWIVL